MVKHDEIKAIIQKKVHLRQQETEDRMDGFSMDMEEVLIELEKFKASGSIKKLKKYHLSLYELNPRNLTKEYIASSLKLQTK